MGWLVFLCDADLLKKFRVLGIGRPGFVYSDFGNPMHLQSELLLRVIATHSTGKAEDLAGHSICGLAVAQLAAIILNSFT